MTRILLIGLDGFDPDLTGKWMAEGLLPNLSGIADQGLFTPLKSTIPPFTYPAWSSLLTGVNPGRHGITDFAVRRPGSYSVEYINSTYRLTPTLFKRLSDAGKRVAAMGFPTTYPPEPVNGIMIAGFDSPLAFNADRSFCYPADLWNELKNNGTAYTLAGIQELNTGGRWKQKAESTIYQTIRARTHIAKYLYRKEQWNVFGIVFSESDTASHHFWSSHDRNSPRYCPENEAYSNVLKTVYTELDSSVGQLVNLADPDTLVLVVSDHGSGGTGDKLLSLNRLLEKKEWFKFTQPSGKKITRDTDMNRQNSRSEFSVPWTKKMASMLPARFGELIFRYAPKRFLDILESRNRLEHADLSGSIAFSDELNYFPSVWLNDDRFPAGRHYTANQRKDVLNHIRDHLLSYTLPDTGKKVIKTVYFRDDLFYGPAMEWIPDVIIVPEMDGDYSVTLWNAPDSGPVLVQLPKTEMTGHKGGSMNGSHRPFGVLVTNRTPLLEPDEIPCLEDIGTTIMVCSGLNPDRFLPDGRSLFHPPHDRTLSTGADTDLKNCKPDPYTEQESRIVRERLERLGYL